MNREENNVIRLGEVLEELDFKSSTFEQRQDHIKNMLARFLNLGTVVALIGAGASIPIGYLSWREFAEKTLDKARKNVDDDNQSATIEKYLGYLKERKGNELSAQVMLRECERLWDDHVNKLRGRQVNRAQGKRPESFREYIKDDFKKMHAKFSQRVPVADKRITYKNKLDAKHNPYVALLEMPIRRFITTNYDLEIERAILIKKNVRRTWSGGKKGEASIEEIVEWSEQNSFYQDVQFCDQLARFPLARYDGNQHMVFHCHGRIDAIDSCIITETDYQAWYLKEDSRYFPFRQALDLTLSSNPILIIGYSLGDADLMRWLRMITANRSEDKFRNPLFCINYIKVTKDENTPEHRELMKAECDALYMKYGLHVIPVLGLDEKGNEVTLCDALSDIKKRWESWVNGLLLKPKFRATPTSNYRKTGYYHYRLDFDQSTNPILSVQKELEEQLVGMIDKLEDQRPGLAVIVGDGGTGKSWSVQKYLKEKEDEWAKNEKGKFIFWSSYYANDVLTGIDRLIHYLSSQGDGAGVTKKAKSRVTKDQVKLTEMTEGRFEKLLRLISAQKGHVVIVFDGIEKLLIPDTVKTDGRSISPEVKRFFRMISDNYIASKYKGKKLPASQRFKCHIILTTRLFPLDILPDPDSDSDIVDPRELRKEIEVFATRCWTKDLLREEGSVAGNSRRDTSPGIDTFMSLYRNDPDIRKVKISSLCSLVDGQVFCIALVRGILEDLVALDMASANATDPAMDGYGKAEAKFEELERKISNTPIDRRVYRVIREAIEHLDSDVRYADDGGIVGKFIERIALFMHPVRREVAAVCYDDAQEKIKSESPNTVAFKTSLDRLLTELVRKSLLQPVILKTKSQDGSSEELGYVVHPLVRSFVHQTLHKSQFASLPSLQLSGITTMEVVDPGTRETGVNVTQSLFQKLCRDAARPYDEWREDKRNEPTLEEKRISSDQCRGAFSILRSRFSANTVTRWGDYGEYLRMVVNLYDTSKKVSEGLWLHNEPTKDGQKLTTSFDKDKPAPLYADEIAWLYNEIGLTSITMGHVLNAIPFREQGLEISRMIDNNRNGRYLFQAEFNLSTAYMFLGRLSTAMHYLNKAFIIATKLTDIELISRTKAYIAYVKYLQGRLEEADEEFTEAYTGLENNQRAKGIFYCYHGEVLLKLDKKPQAKAKIDQSRHIGEAEFYPDIIASARLANANYLVREGKYDEAQSEYSFVLKEAKRTRFRRLQAGTLSGMSRLAYRLNDSEVAKQRAVESLKIANEYALCLHQTIGMIVLGKALVKEGTQRVLGIACLKTARDMANLQGNFLRKNEAAQALQELKVE